MNPSGFLTFAHDLFERCQIGIVTDVKYALDNNGKTTNIFTGFVGVQLLQESMRFDFVRVTNVAFGGGGNKYGIITVPMVDDIVFIDFDIQNKPYIKGMIWYDQLIKGIGGEAFSPNPSELADNRLQINPGETRIRGVKGNSLTVQDDGSIIYRVDDTQPDTSSPVVLIDSQGNLSASNLKDTKIQCQTAELNAATSATITTGTAEVAADHVTVQSDDITLGKTGSAAPIIRNTDKVEHIDPILGIPIFSDYYVTNSGTTKSK